MVSYCPMRLKWNLKFSDVSRNRVLCPWRYVATVCAIKIGNNIILATRTLHRFLFRFFVQYSLRVSLNTLFGNRYFPYRTEIDPPVSVNFSMFPNERALPR